MGKTVTFDEHVHNAICSLTKSNSFKTGLLIGQSTLQKDIVVHICTTPSQDEVAVKDSDKEKDSKKGKQVKKKPEIQDELNENWICQHAKQVTRMLPGGLDILGIFVIAGQDELNKLQHNLRQILFAIFKVLSKDQKLSLCHENTEKILLQIATFAQKFVCRTFDVSDYKSSAKPAEWKQFSGVFQWHKLECKFNLDFRIPVDKNKITHSLLKQIEIGLLPFFNTTSRAAALVNGKFRKDEELLDPSMEGKKGKHSNKSSQQYFALDLFLPLHLNNSDDKDPQILECSAAMTVKGTIQCRAYIHNKGTVKEAIQVLKHDIIRSMTSRCEIQCEDLLLIDEEQQDPHVVHELPRRVFASLPQGNLSVCDYLFHGDSASDSLEAFQELLGLNLSEDDVEMNFEKTPDTLQLFQPETIQSGYSETTEKTKTRNILYPIVGAAVAVLAFGVTYFLSQEI
ncbi:protein odr-4 homolog isoform X1 [Centruroides sculpturatus]|uniref:protein odr-4 homolog isoform X1 n=1 Tax=Centruroides sculpturatus TaxID=218467 RepID=UPI000C6E193E|nr:protein odr-4 homolog isoform X1 [Centruroides sculpturatus]